MRYRILHPGLTELRNLHIPNRFEQGYLPAAEPVVALTVAGLAAGTAAAEDKVPAAVVPHK